MSKQVLVRFYWDYGRQGNVEGLFVTDEATLEKAYGKQVYFGEILGKHSEVYGTLERKDITLVTDDQDFITRIVDLLGEDLSGYNPLDKIEESDEEE